jgi:predicted RNase H-like HicB family nuclease
MSVTTWHLYTEKHLGPGRLENAMKYAIVIERAGSNYSAYVPDLPGCVATGGSIDETKERMAEAIAMHLEGMREDGVTPPAPSVVCDYVAVPA